MVEVTNGVASVRKIERSPLAEIRNETRTEIRTEIGMNTTKTTALLATVWNDTKALAIMVTVTESGGERITAFQRNLEETIVLVMLTTVIVTQTDVVSMLIAEEEPFLMVALPPTVIVVQTDVVSRLIAEKEPFLIVALPTTVIVDQTDVGSTGIAEKWVLVTMVSVDQIDVAPQRKITEKAQGSRLISAMETFPTVIEGALVLVFPTNTRTIPEAPTEVQIEAVLQMMAFVGTAVAGLIAAEDLLIVVSI